MEAVVLGGGGLTGRCTVRDLAQGRRFDRVRVADLDGGLAEAAARATGSDRVTWETLDVRDPVRLRATLKGASVCVNAVQYVHHLPVMEGCLAEGVPYLDFGGLFHTTQRQLMLSKRFEEAGLLAIPGLGQVPGASNVLAAAATEDLDQVESLIFRDAWRDLTVGGPEIYFPWSPSTFLDEMELPAMVWEGGAYEAHPPMSSPEEYDFAPPIGRARVYRTLHSEPATLPHSLRSKGLRHCEWKEGGPGIDLLRQLALLGLGSSEAIDVRGHPVVPRELFLALLKHRHLLGVPEGIAIDDWEVLDIEVRGHRGGRAVLRHALARFPPKRSWGFTATEYAVGVCGAIGAELLVEGIIRDTGVIPPEVCVPAKPFRAALQQRGIDTVIAPDEGALPPFREA
ncbi:MAG: saccharopine dehydrogenase NADP-binding domain-containing protein [Thermoplasmata archaeon]|nr:saccharopine dehydrogenase NADP-binding domain-containing protein [Thermoplasmata archaeon]